MNLNNASLWRRSSCVVLTGMLVLCAAVPAATAASIAPSYVYGIDDSNDIWEIDPAGKTAEVVYGTGRTGQSNAFAFDTVRDQMFFIDANKDLYYWNHGTTVAEVATAAQLGVSDPAIAQPWNAAYYNNAFWFFNTDSDQLNKVSLSYSGAGAPAFDSRTTYQISGIPYETNPGDRNRFGDIAIICSGPDTGMLYAATSWPTANNGLFYSLDLNSLTSSTGSATPIKGSGTPDGNGNPNLQLSFNGDYTTLYGHDYNGGKWYTVDLGSGDTTEIAGFTTIGFRDLGGASLSSVDNVPEIDPGMYGSAIALLTGFMGLFERRSRRRLV